MKKNVIKIILIITIIVITLIFFASKYKVEGNKIKTEENESYSLIYDDTWQIKSKDETNINLVHRKSNSNLDININELKDEMQYRELDEIIEDYLYDIQQNNKDYNLIYKEDNDITKLLFETENGQVATYIYKQGNRLVVFKYKAENSYFDILLDSVNNIVYNFKLKEIKFDVETQIKLQIQEINYTEQKNIVNMLSSNTQEYEIANFNYLVKYSIPDNFKKRKYDSTSDAYYWSEDSNEGRIYFYVNTNILNTNIYEYLDKEKYGNIYGYVSSENKKDYEALNKFSEEPLSYIYKCSEYKNNKLYEDITVAYELDRNHVFIVKISSEGLGIPEEMVKKIKINECKNISSNIKIKKEDSFLIGTLLQYADVLEKQTIEITLKLPEDFQEIDKGGNLYRERNYGYKYDSEKQKYEYEQ